MNLLEAAKQALEALRGLVINLDDDGYSTQLQMNLGRADKAITNLRAAIEEAEKVEPVAEHDLKDVRCECCGYMTYHREHMGCIRAATPTIPEGWKQSARAWLESLFASGDLDNHVLRDLIAMLEAAPKS